MADEYIRKADAVSIAESYEVKRDGFHLNDYEYGRNQVADSIASDLEDMPPADVVPVTWIRRKIDKSIGMEHAMWQKLLRIWENEQLRKYVRNLKDDNK